MTARIPLIALVGRPNVGKSAIYNRLSGRWSSIVEDRPGITRDYHISKTEIHGHAVSVMDTGGLLLDAPDTISKKIRDQTLAAAAKADLVLFVVDGREGLTQEDEGWLKHFRKWRMPKLFVINKMDHGDDESVIAEFRAKGMKPMVTLSAERQRNFSGLSEAILSALKLTELPVTHEAQGDNEEIDSTDKESAGDSDESLSKFKKHEGPLRVAIIGRPNVGKSSLMNALLGVQRSLTHDEPGTTRDTVHDTLATKDFTIELADTAGIRKRAKSPSRVEKFSIIQAKKAIDESEMVLLVMDGSSGPVAQDTVVAGYAFEKQRPLIIVVNKWDIGSKIFKREDIMLTLERLANYLKNSIVLFVSARTGKNVDRIMSALKELKEESGRALKTSDLNRFCEDLQHHHAPPVYRGKNVRIYYAVQTGIHPPSFTFFVNDPKHIHFSYQRYIIQSLREALGIKHAPVRISFKGKKK